MYVCMYVCETAHQDNLIDENKEKNFVLNINIVDTSRTVH